MKYFVQSSWLPSIKSSVTSSKADDRKSRYQITGLTFSEPNLYISNMTNRVRLMLETSLSFCNIFLRNTVNSCCNKGHYVTSLHTIWQRIEVRHLQHKRYPISCMGYYTDGVMHKRCGPIATHWVWFQYTYMVHLNHYTHILLWFVISRWYITQILQGWFSGTETIILLPEC